MQDFRKLKIWRKGHDPTLAVYEASASFPKEELFGLTSQMRRAAASVPANIAEGCSRGGNTELARFLQIAAGSSSELEYHLLLARDLKLLQNSEHERLAGETTQVKRMLTALARQVRITNNQKTEN